MITKPRLLTVLEITHYDEDNQIIWQEKNIGNTWHQEGQEFILSVAFDTDGGFTVPSQYYLGLDNRTSISETDTLSSLTGEPSSGGYTRQSVSSTTGFSVGVTDNKIKALSSIVTFQASVASFGPISKLFLTTVSSGSTGYLIASAALSSERTVLLGQSLTTRISLSLGGC